MLQYFTFLIAIKRSEVAASEDRGASAVEYGLLVAAIAALIVIVVFALGGIIQEVFQDTCDVIKAEAGTPIASTCK